MNKFIGFFILVASLGNFASVVEAAQTTTTICNMVGMNKGNYDLAYCALMVPSSPTVTALLPVLGTSKISYLLTEDKKEVIIAAQDSAATFIALDGRSDKDAVLNEAFVVLGSVQEEYHLTDTQVAELILLISSH